MRFLLLVLWAFSGIAAANTTYVCAQLLNETGQTLDYTISENKYQLTVDEQSKIYVLPSASTVQLFDGAITLFAGRPELTSGHFNMTYANYEPPQDVACSVFYQVSIFK